MTGNATRKVCLGAWTCELLLNISDVQLSDAVFLPFVCFMLRYSQSSVKVSRIVQMCDSGLLNLYHIPSRTLPGHR